VQFSHAFSVKVYDFHTVSPEYFGYTLVYDFVCVCVCVSMGRSLRESQMTFLNNSSVRIEPHRMMLLKCMTESQVMFT
jgi:hypothetical protein